MWYVIYYRHSSICFLFNLLLLDFIDPLKWVAENLEEVALDQEAEGYDPNAEGIPLVPISNDCVQAMEEELFKKILMGLE